MPFLGDDIGRDICDVDLLPAHQHGRDVVVVIVVVVHHLNIVILNNGDTEIRLRLLDYVRFGWVVNEDTVSVFLGDKPLFLGLH